MKKGVVAALLATTGLAAACSFLGHQAFQQPIVHLQKVEVAGIGITGGSLNVELSVFNPNHYRLDATQLRYRVMLNSDSVQLATGTLNNQFTVNDNDSTVVKIPVDFTYAGVGAAARSLLNTGVVTYHVLGDITVGSTVGSYTVPYSQTGRFTTTGVAR
jgi:LEA14-like dessication related protein